MFKLLLLFLLLVGTVHAQRVSDVRNTPHNLSAQGPGTTRAAAGGTTEVCVFCHTPHGASQADAAGTPLRGPLWNRRVPDGATYTPYTSSSLDAQSILDGLNATPGGSSKLCLSCHVDQAGRHPGQNCAQCHAVPGQRPAGAGR